MQKDNEKDIYQLTLKDMVEYNLRAGVLSSDEINELIHSLRKAKIEVDLKEAEEKERMEREQKLREERERIEKEKHSAHVKEVTSMDLPLDWENVFEEEASANGISADSISDGLILSLTNLGKVDIEYISAVTGENYKTVISELKGSIFQNPEKWEECFYKGWETSEEYLSGNMMCKWKIATEANRTYEGYFEDNVKAIEAVLPASIPTEDIYITLGSPWVPSDVIDDFIEEVFGKQGCYYGDENDLKVVHDEVTGSWEIPFKTRYQNSILVTERYGTKRMTALYILEKTLNMQTIAVKDEVPCQTTKSGKRRQINQSETLAALDKQKKLIEKFQSWVWKDRRRKERLEIIYENNFGAVRKREFNGDFLSFPTMSENVSLYPYQKNAVARIIFSPNTLLAHDVGSGKTYVMIAAGQELRRMGLSKKNMYVVPNNLVGQWKQIFLHMYPTANILCVDSKSFVPKKRESVLMDIRDGDYDGIIIAYSCFEQIPLSKDCYIEEIQGKKDLVEEIIHQKSKVTHNLKKLKENLDQALKDLKSVIDDVYDTVYFDELGITRLFVDEAHNFKNVPVDTKSKNVLGISTTGSKKCIDMMDKVHLIQRNNDGGGVVFATGTPITNSITDAFVMQQYLQDGELSMLDLQHFDSWIGMFAEMSTVFEIDVDTSTYRMARRFSKFHNLPELTVLLSSIADFHQVDKADGVPEMDGRTDSVITKTPELSAYLEDISYRADAVRNHFVTPKEDNILKITVDGRKAALDVRLVDSTASFNFNSKVYSCAENVADIYFKTSSEQLTQLVFCDTSTPKNTFNIYDELKRILISMGVPESQIKYVHEADTEKKRAQLFMEMQTGMVRILIGSTFKVGMGVNVQNRLIAVHHIDVPWRPSDMTQREGRILRQGNMNPKVKIFRYITEGSFDAYSWQLLETKQHFIEELISGSLTERSGGDIDNTVLDYAEIKALAIGNPLIKERVETANELLKYKTLRSKKREARERMELELHELPKRISDMYHNIEMCSLDLEYYRIWKEENPICEDKKAKEDLSQDRKELRELIGNAVHDNILETKERELINYRGFKIILPTNMTADKAYIWLERNGRYRVDLGASSTGMLIRIDNFLENFEKKKEEFDKAIVRLEVRKKEIEEELARKDNVDTKFEDLQAHLKNLDRKLGVS